MKEYVMGVVVEQVALRSGTTAEWAAAGATVLDAGELGVDTTTGTIKVGDGATAFATLPGSGLRVKSSGRATLITGSKVVLDAAVDADDNILYAVQALGTVSAPKAIAVTGRSPGVSFTLTSSDNTDTSVVYYQIIG